MTAAEILSELHARRVEVAVIGGRLRYRPASAVPEALLSELRANGAELIQLLSARETPRLQQALPGGVTDPKQSVLIAEVVAMTLDEFAQAGLIVEVASRVLDEVVLFASDNAVLDPGERRVVCRAQELREVLHYQPEDLVSVHNVKKVFGGTIQPS
jgi:hypothetical protein